MNESLASQQVVNAKLRAGASDLRRAMDSTARRDVYKRQPFTRGNRRGLGTLRAWKVTLWFP